MRSTAGWTALAGALAIVAMSGGCAPPAAKPGRPSSGTLPVVPLDPDSAITVDSGRLSVRSPVGWQRGPRSDDCLVRYTPSAQRTHPAIVVLAAEAPEGFAEVTAANQAAFVKAVAAGLAETYASGGRSTLLERPRAVTVGPHRGAAWTAPGTAKVDGLKQGIERSCVAIVVGGRMVTVEARAPKGRLDDEGRAAARGVAAGISTPPAGDESPTDDPTTDESPAAAPADQNGLRQSPQAAR